MKNFIQPGDVVAVTAPTCGLWFARGPLMTAD
jgi:hypothetical protein